MTGITIPRGSREYISATLTDLNGADLTEQQVEMSIHKGAAIVWLPAVWDDGHVRSEAPVTFGFQDYTLSSYDVSVRLTDTPEAPVVRVGTIRVIN